MMKIMPYLKEKYYNYLNRVTSAYALTYTEFKEQKRIEYNERKKGKRNGNKVKTIMQFSFEM